MYEKKIIKPRLTPSLEQIMDICSQYDIGELLSVAEVIPNTANINIKLLTKKGEFVIKIFTSVPQRFDFILNTLEKLKRNSLPVLLPIKNKKGQNYSKFGSKLLQVTEFSHGYPFIFDEMQARSSGVTLRRFHKILSDTNNPVKPKASLYPSSSIIKKGIHALERMKGEIPKERICLVNTLYCKVIDKWETKSKHLPKTIIHGDWHQGNQLYDQMGEVCCIMDFDYMARAERIFDVAYALWCFRINTESINIAKSFMQGYGALSREEISLLPLELARINYFFICSSGLSPNPKHELDNQYRLQYPFMMWALSKDGENIIKRLCEK